MKKYKVVFWNPIMCQKRTYTFVVTRDDYNHLWNVEILYQFWNETDTIRLRWDYKVFIDKFVSSECRDGEYITIKEVA